MLRPPLKLSARSPFVEPHLAACVHRGFAIELRDGLGICNVIARKGRKEALVARMRDQFGIDLPRGSHRTVAADIALAGVAPQAWLATREHAGNGLADLLRKGYGDIAAVVDQSDGYVLLRLSGTRVRDALCKLVPIDVHPRAFQVGDVATSVISHMCVTLWRLEDYATGNSVFEVVISRSLTASLWHAIYESAEALEK